MKNPLLLLLALASPLFSAEPVKVAEKIDLLAVMKKGEVDYHLNDKMEITGKPEEIFILENGQLRISGNGYGYMITRAAYRDYHLITEFKWTGKTLGKRAEKARDNGILIHCHGPAGAVGGTWSASIEAQIIEGGMGDILVLSPKLPDGTIAQSSVDSEFELDRDKERRWKKGSPLQAVTSGRINWEKRDEDWKDVVDFKGADHPEAPLGEWNKLEVIADGGTIKILFNGRIVNEASAAQPSSGPIAIQTEGAEMIVRRYELLPLGGSPR